MVHLISILLKLKSLPFEYELCELRNFTQEFFVVDLMTTFTSFPKYWLGLRRYSTLESPSFMFRQNLIETLFVPVIIYIS